MLRSFMILAIVSLSGCASKMSVTYYSDPSGATLYIDGQSYGRTPQTVYYDVPQDEVENGVALTENLKVVWPSGAKAEAPHLEYRLPPLSNLLYPKYHYTFIRPANAPGLQTDMRFALEFERTELLRNQVNALEAQAKAQHRQAEAQEAIVREQSAPKTCLTIPIGMGSYQTHCY